MRHNKKFNHLSRTHSHRDALLSNMTASLILHKRIFTTLAKAKALRVYAEPLLNRGKEYNMQNWRLVFSRLNNKEAVKELFKEVGPKIANRAGGYTRILKTGNRLGDNAKMCFTGSRSRSSRSRIIKPEGYTNGVLDRSAAGDAIILYYRFLLLILCR